MSAVIKLLKQITEQELRVLALEAKFEDENLDRLARWLNSSHSLF